ncbi:MAG: electron transport complex subunit RsxC [Clostridia bacterium]|nr:electron transport complex subunit RsxC [Clostridia bacterium]
MRPLLRGVRVPNIKTTASKKAVPMPFHGTVTIPMSMHIGAAAEPIVKRGDTVFVGTKIGDVGGSISAPVHSSVSGRVSEIADITTPDGAMCQAVKIESDGKMTPDERISPPQITGTDEFISAVRESGIVGLGGAGFPTHIKYEGCKGRKIEELIVNAAECEPYITSDTRTLLDRSDELLFGIEAVREYLGIKRVIIGIEKHNRAAHGALENMLNQHPKTELKLLSDIYPQGAEKVLVYHTTGKVTPAGKLPLDVGALVSNCTTLAEIGKYLKTGMPLVSKCITVDGGSILDPKNVIAPIGTPISALADFCGGTVGDPYMVLFGGPMMGLTIENADTSFVMKQTNAVTFLSEKEAARKRETACINCGACANHCPFALDPRAFLRAYRCDNVGELGRLRVDICMECGCCSFICPAAKPLVETNKLAKAKLRAYLDEKRAKEKQEGRRERDK